MTSAALSGGGASAGNASIYTVADSETAKPNVILCESVVATKGVPAVNDGGVTSCTAIALNSATVADEGDATPVMYPSFASPVCVAQKTSYTASSGTSSTNPST
ncbi:hypothetical protein N9L76_07955, partial [bacterium]|nr:hypothetical protein [bacterium]